MSDALYIVVQPVVMPMVEGGAPVEWFRATVILNGEGVAVGWAPNVGENKIDNIARKSAITRAQGEFAVKLLGEDIRDAPAPVDG